MLRKHKWKLIMLGFPVVFALLGAVPCSKRIPLGSADYALVTRASFFRSIFPEAYSTIMFHSKHGQDGSVVLWQDIFDGPIILIPGKDTSELLCLYDFDVDLRLFKIDTSKTFNPLPPNSGLNHILFSCTWEIDEGTSGDWQELLNFLQKAS